MIYLATLLSLSAGWPSPPGPDHGVRQADGAAAGGRSPSGWNRQPERVERLRPEHDAARWCVETVLRWRRPIGRSSPPHSRRMPPTPAASSARSQAARQPAVDLRARKRERYRAIRRRRARRHARKDGCGARARLRRDRTTAADARSCVLYSASSHSADSGFARMSSASATRSCASRTSAAAHSLWRCIYRNRAAAVGQEQRSRMSEALDGMHAYLD